SGTDPQAAELLGGERLRPAAALRHGNGRWHVPYRDVPARDRPRTLARRLRAALAATQGRALRRQPQPPAALLPVSGRAETFAGGDPGYLPGIARGARHQPEGA